MILILVNSLNPKENMSKKIYKSAKGKVVDIDALRAKNAKTIAVGKHVNAQGDILGKGDTVVKTRAERNKEIYSNKPTPGIDDSGDFNPTQRPAKKGK
jgi:hypothetical protein